MINLHVWDVVKITIISLFLLCSLFHMCVCNVLCSCVDCPILFLYFILACMI